MYERCHQNTIQIFFVGMLDSSRIFPYEHKVLEGKRIAFYCTSKGDVRWYNNKESLILTGDSLLLTEVSVSQEGYYQCQGTDDEDQVFWARGKLIVIGEWCNTFLDTNIMLGKKGLIKTALRLMRVRNKYPELLWLRFTKIQTCKSF